MSKSVGMSTTTPLRAIGFVLLCATQTGCGGGGHSGGTVGTTPATAAPTSASCAISSSVTCSVLTFSSNPQGLAVKLNGASLGVTPVNVTPPFTAPTSLPSPYALTGYAITPSNAASPFPYVFQQVDNGNHTVFYNQTADTEGSIGAITTTLSVARQSASIASSGSASRVRRSPMREARRRKEYDDAHVLVVYRASSLQSAGSTIADAERSVGVSAASSIGPYLNGTITRLATVPAGQTAAALIAKLQSNSAVVTAYEPHMRYAFGSAVMPNDPFFSATAADQNYGGYQWDMYRIGSPNAWGYTEGSSSIAIAIIDTGIDVTQGDFPTGSKVTYAEEVLNGVKTVGTSSSPIQDQDGHGTNVAGIAAAATNNSFGVAGVGFNAGLQEYRIFPTPVAPLYSEDPNYGTNTADEAQAIDDAVANGAKIINLSLGAPPVDSSGNTGFDPTEYAAIENAISKGVAVVAAAGNESASSLDFPAAYQGVISVGATDINDGNTNLNVIPTYSSSMPDTFASYSNYGPGLSLAAPGGDPTNGSSSDDDLLHWITSDYSTTVADPNEQCSSTPCLAQIAGTSQATPHVSGAIALMLAANPSLSPAQSAQILESTADDIGDARQGHGRLDLYRALASASGNPPPSAPTNANFVAIAYATTAGSNTPTILDETYTHGVAVASNGSFRIADIPVGAAGYRIGVWYDANGDGIVDQGDWFGATATTCAATAPCGAATGITASLVPAGFVLN